jgi:HPt (histidine-containing phosphotransfer) domain-containing protein
LLLDEEILAQLRMLGEADSQFHMGLLDAFEAQMADGLQAMAACATQGLSAELSAHAHKLRGSSLNLGAQAMAQLLEQLELQVTTLTPQQVEGLLQQLTATWGDTRTAMHAYFAQR